MVVSNIQVTLMFLLVMLETTKLPVWLNRTSTKICLTIDECIPKVDEVLSMECDKELEEGRNPGPMVEIEFWEAKCRNLESLFDQVALER